MKGDERPNDLVDIFLQYEEADQICNKIYEILRDVQLCRDGIRWQHSIFGVVNKNKVSIDQIDIEKSEVFFEIFNFNLRNLAQVPSEINIKDKYLAVICVDLNQSKLDQVFYKHGMENTSDIRKMLMVIFDDFYEKYDLSELIKTFKVQDEKLLHNYLRSLKFDVVINAVSANNPSKGRDGWTEINKK